MGAKKKADDSQQPQPRRGKTEASTNNSNSNKKNEVATAMKDQLNRSREQIYKNKLSTQVLHLQWKRHLLNLSYLLIVLSFMQFKGPSLTCLQDIKAYNNNQNQQQENETSGGLLISGIDAMKIVCTDSIVPTIAIVMAAALSFFLIQTASITTYTSAGKDARSQFSNPNYIFACACIPIILVISQIVQAKGDKEGCIDDMLQQAGIFPSDLEMKQRPSRGFPVVLVFHVIVTICFGFMESQMNLHERGLVQIDKLLQELHDSTTGSSSNDSNKSKTTSKENVGKPTESKKSK